MAPEPASNLGDAGLDSRNVSRRFPMDKRPGRASPLAATTRPGLWLFDGGEASVGSVVRKWGLGTLPAAGTAGTPASEAYPPPHIPGTPEPDVVVPVLRYVPVPVRPRTFIGLLFQEPPRSTFRPRSLSRTRTGQTTARAASRYSRAARDQSTRELLAGFDPSRSYPRGMPFAFLASGGENVGHSPVPAGYVQERLSSPET